MTLLAILPVPNAEIVFDETESATGISNRSICHYRSINGSEATVVLSAGCYVAVDLENVLTWR